MTKNLFSKLFSLFAMLLILLVAVACGETTDPVKATLAFDAGTKTVEVGDEFSIKTTITGVDASTLVEFTFSNDGIVEYKDGKFTALKEGTVTITGTVKGYPDAKATLSVTVNKKAVQASVKLTLSAKEGYPGDDITVSTAVTGEIEDKSLEYSVSSANATYASGKLHLVAIGEVTLTVKLSAYPEISDSVTVTIKEKPATISITPGANSIAVGGKANVAVATDPSGLEVEWSTSDAAVATVDNGVVTGVAKGTATIKATIKGTTTSAEFEITVATLVESITATYVAEMNLFDAQDIVVTVGPETADDKTYTVTSSNEDAIIASGDTLTALEGGTSTITITANDGSGVKYEFTVTVIDKASEILAAVCDPEVASYNDGDEYEYNGVTYIVGKSAFATLAPAYEATLKKLYIAAGTYENNITIDKEGIEVIGPNAGVNPSTITRLPEAIMKGTIIIAANMKNIKITGLAFTATGGIDCSDACENIEVTYNNVYDTNSGVADWVETRVDCEAVFAFWSVANNEGKNFTFAYNKFDNIQEPGIFVARAKNVYVRNNTFHNFTQDAFRADGGYNYGTWEFDNNKFENDVMQGYNGIYLQSISGSDDDGVQTILITNNSFKNIGNETTSIYNCAISNRTYQEKGIKFDILYNTFENCKNYFDLRNNGGTVETCLININYNKFIGVPTGVYHRNITAGSNDTAASNPTVANMDYNLFTEADGTVISDLTPYAAKFLEVKSYANNFTSKEAYETKLKELIGVSYNFVVNGAWKDLAVGTKVEADGFTWTFGDNAFATINECLSGLENGTTIKVFAGTYVEEIGIGINNVTLIGPNKGVNAQYINREAEAILSKKITISQGVSNFTLDGFQLEGAACIIMEKDASNIAMKYCVINGTSNDGVMRAPDDNSTPNYVSDIKFIGNYSNNYKGNRVLHLTWVHGLEATNNYINCSNSYDFLNVQGSMDGEVIFKDNTYIKSLQSFLYVKKTGAINVLIQGNYVENIANTIIDFRNLNTHPAANTYAILNNTFKSSGAEWCPIRIRTADYADGDTIAINVNYNKFIDSYTTGDDGYYFAENPSFSTQADPFKVIYNMDNNYYEINHEAIVPNDNKYFSGAALSWNGTYENVSEMPEYAADTQIKPTSVQITNKIEGLDAYDTYQLTFTIGPEDATNKKVGFSSDNANAAVVTTAGLIQAKSGGTAVITVYSIADSTIIDTMTIVISPKSRIELRSEGDGLLVVGKKDTQVIQGTFYGADTSKMTFTSSDPSIATVDENGTVKGLKAGSVIITASQGGKEATIGFTVIETELTGLLKLLAEGNHSTIWNQDIMYIGSDDGSADYQHNIYGSANDYYAATLPAVTRNMLPTTAANYDGKKIEKLEFVVIHDTAGSPSTSTAWANSHWCTNTSNSGSSWHYTIGNDGIYQQVEETDVTWHAGDGTGWATSTTLYDTGIAYEGDRPTVTIGDDHYFYVNGKKSNVQSPSETVTQINDLGMVCVKGDNGNYFIPTTYVATSFGSRVCARGGNLNGIGIETAVNMGSDVYLTWQYTAKFVADILVRNDLAADRVWFHNNFSNKKCPRTMITADRVETFLKLVYMEYNVKKDYSDYTIEFISDAPSILDNSGRVVKTPELTTNVSYTIKITNKTTSATEEIKLNTLVIGQYNL